jgi:hypothetical protein
MPHIDLIFFNAGGGHRAAAEALREVMSGEGSPWCVRLLNLFEVLDPQDRFRRLTGMPPEELYNRRLARGWTLGMAQELKLLQAAIRLAHPQLVQRLQRYWHSSAPDLAGRWCRTSTWRSRRVCRPLGRARPSSPCSPTWPTTRRISGLSAGPGSMWSAAPSGPCNRRGRWVWTSATCTAARA